MATKMCALCKTNPSVAMVRIADKETGELLDPVPLCNNCLIRVSKARHVETVSGSNLSIEAQTAVRESQQSRSVSKSTPYYMQNLRKLCSIFEALRGISIVLLIIGIIGAFVGYTVAHSVMVGTISISVAFASIAGILHHHILLLIFDAIEDYVDTHRV